MNTIKTLPKTTFSGRRFTRKQLAQVQETVEEFKNLSRREIALTICEHLDWKTPNGQLKIQSCHTLLEALESHGILTLPAKKKSKAPVRRTPVFDEQPDTTPVTGELASLGQISLQLITSDKDRKAWKAYLYTYHYLGYKHPVGSHLGYFIISEKRQQKLGCLLFSASAAWALAPRDELIGWEKKHRQKLLNLIISNDRLLIFPWIDVPNLASKVLSLATKQIGGDWANLFGYRPVLIETFVDTTKYSGTCYRAANWQNIGKTKGRGRFDPNHEHKKTIKDIYIYPLESDWQHTLTNSHLSKILKKKYRNDIQSSNTRLIDDTFVEMWEKVVAVIKEIATQYDDKWQIRRRVLDSMLIIILIFRLVCSKNSQSYGTTIDELWDSCDRLDLPLPQKHSIAPSSFCAARKKLDETAFKLINHRIITAYAQQYQFNSYGWLNHRVFAVDGSRINLPRELLHDGYKLPSKISHYPQGLLSCLYQLKSQMPYDFDLVPHKNERVCAKSHLQVLKEDDVVVYDRGYFSYDMFHEHLRSKIHAIFRLQKSSYNVVSDFFASSQTDIITLINPSPHTRRSIKLKHPNLKIVPLQIRLIKYQVGSTTYCLGTTLVDQKKYSNIQDFKDIYHARWGVEELYKISKCIFNIEEFHAKSERGIKQEIFAHFVLITMNRIFANQANSDLNQSNCNKGNDSSSLMGQKTKNKINFKNCTHVFTKSLEELVLLKTKMNSAVERVYRLIIGRFQKERPGRSYDRKSMKPRAQWHSKKTKKTELVSSSKLCSNLIS